MVEVDGVFYNIDTTEDCYVSPWSKFIVSVMPPVLDNMVVCDFGSGTGIISIKAALNGAKEITAIEKDPESRNLLQRNIAKNNISEKVNIYERSHDIINSEYYDYIFCNPACYPSMVGNSSFFYAGETGMDMIFEVFNFAKRALKKDGHLLILIPSVSPSSMAFDLLKTLGLYERPAPSKDVLVPFREYLTDKIKNWVDGNKAQYPEVHYYVQDVKYYEKVFLYSIHFKENKNFFKNIEDRFFDGFEYTIETLPHNVITCIDAANAKMIPLEHELKSLVLKTDKGLYILSLSGKNFADFRAVKKTLGVEEAHMASDAELTSLGLKKGAVCPVLKILWNMPQLVSKEVFDLQYVSTNSGKLNECIMFSPNELLKHQKLLIGEFSREERNSTI
jgi:prolyl-tRNA editing enzyme YbaK/EbsC (Cys-tRNA(Pro) deacylase)/methylase of polypeptide subunit release factors